MLVLGIKFWLVEKLFLLGLRIVDVLLSILILIFVVVVVLVLDVMVNKLLLIVLVWLENVMAVLAVIIGL